MKVALDVEEQVEVGQRGYAGGYCGDSRILDCRNNTDGVSRRGMCLDGCGEK